MRRTGTSVSKRRGCDDILVAGAQAVATFHIFQMNEQPADSVATPCMIDRWGAATVSGQREITFDRHLVRMALALGAKDVGVWTDAELALVEPFVHARSPDIAKTLRRIRKGADPLGELYCAEYDRATRRPNGITLTPPEIVAAMVDWASAAGATPETIIDPGTGTGRFLVAAGRRFKNAALIGIESDPVLAVLARANLAAAGLASRAEVVLSDFRSWQVPQNRGQCLFIGNPPYVRHHLISEQWKMWLSRNARSLGLNASQLAGLHVHFLLAVALKARLGDFGTLVTSSEWLDVNYGKLARDLFLEYLGGTSLTIIEPTGSPFADAATTATISGFRVGAKTPSIFVRRVHAIGELSSTSGSTMIRKERFETAARWSHLTRGGYDLPREHVELGELFAVHRGQVTGANRIWIAGQHSRVLPETVLFKSVTKAKELIRAGESLTNETQLRSVIDIPADLDELDSGDKDKVLRFLSIAEDMGGASGYVATHRKSWWSVGLRGPASILATYMARRAPAFARNEANARHINVAHGLYPREALSEALLMAIVRWLTSNVSQALGRTYAGGLTKFEPREMERIPIPEPSLLLEVACAG